MSPTRSIDPNTAEQIQALTTAYRDAEETYHRARDRWQRAIADAVDHGMTIRDAAQLAGVTRSRITPIIARVYSRAEG